MTSISKFIEQKLKLKINREKSKVRRSREVKFLGMTIIDGTVAISWQSIKRAMLKVKELTPRGTHLSLELTMKRINEWYIGWSSYHLMTKYPSQFAKIEGPSGGDSVLELLTSRRGIAICQETCRARSTQDQAAKTAQSNDGRWA